MGREKNSLHNSGEHHDQAIKMPSLNSSSLPWTFLY